MCCKVMQYTYLQVNGYVFNAAEEKNIQTLLACAIGARPDTDRFEDLESNCNES